SAVERAGRGNQQIDCRGLPLLAALELEAQLLALMQFADAGAFDVRNVHEHILRSVFRLNEAVAFLGIEPLHGSDRHSSFVLRIVECEPPRKTGGGVNHSIDRKAGPALDGAWKSRPNHEEVDPVEMGSGGGF